ncbi:MAG: AAA family ATPase [Acidimicrobiia bacterium]|nr:AAA family ATPase [Acidimicrobiia bacterium]
MAGTQTATVLVTDLVGSTELRVRLGEEGADELRRRHDGLLTTSVVDNGGTVVKGLGDGVLATFESASDAVGAAVAIQQGAYAHNRQAPDMPLDIRVGISAGDITLEDGDCFGTPVVEASRLCAVALGSQILAAELVRLLARGRGGYSFTASGERELKGLPEPVPVCTVGWDPPEITAAPVPFPPRLVTPGVLPFSGRDPQLDVLTHAWKEAAAGERRAVLVSGEPGIGKTRLAAEVARLAHDMGAAALFGRCDEDMGVPFQPFVEALEHVVHSGVGAESLGRHANELVRIVPDVGQLVPGLEPPLSADPETERYRLFDAIGAWLSAMSNPGGVVLVLDDLHWAEKPTLLLLRHLIRSSDPIRLLVVGTYRDTDLDRTHPLSEVLADLRREPGVQRLSLTGLDVEGITEMLAVASGERMDVRAADLAQLLWNETEGNPFFVQEIIRSLVESGRIVQRDGVWTTDFDLDELGIPEGVREVIGRRLTRLSDNANAVLAAASVIGAVVDVDVLIEVSGMGEDIVLDALDEAAAASLLRDTSSGTYEFTHALVRSTLYDELSTARRSRRHRQVAEALERRGDGDMAALAYHFGRAGAVDERAIEYARAAGEMALSQLAFDQAVAFFAQALDAADVDAADELRCALSIGLGTAQRLAGIPDYRATLFDAGRLAQRLGKFDLLAEAVLAANRGFWNLTGFFDEEYASLLEAALDGLGPSDSVLRARLLAVLALEMSWHDPDQRRFAISDEAVAMARRLGDDPTLLQVWTTRQLSASVGHTVRELVDEDEDVLALADRVGDPFSQMLASTWATMHAMEVGDFARADRYLARMAQLTEDVGTPVFQWMNATYRCTRMMVSRPGDEVEAAALAAFQIGSDSGQPDALTWFAPAFFQARRAQGRLGEILDLCRQQTVDNPGLRIWEAALGFALVEAGELDEAREVLADVVGDGSTDPFPYDRVWLMANQLLGYVIAGVGTADQAAQQYEVLRPYSDWTSCVGTLVLESVDVALGQLAVRAGWPDVADRHFAAADALHSRLDAPLWLARTRLPWGRLAFDRGDTARAVELLESAHELAARMGAADIEAAAAELLAGLRTPQ